MGPYSAKQMLLGQPFSALMSDPTLTPTNPQGGVCRLGDYSRIPLLSMLSRSLGD